jgi:ATP-dependent RNA helicase HelY
MLPAIYFIFSRKGCDIATQQCLRETLRLTDSGERAQIREIAEARCSYLDDDDLEVLGYSAWLEALVAGIAAHHAGLIPVFKETVEELFQAGLVKVVFATETLSLGINMPARSVVIESLTKFTGERHELMTPGEFTQLTGRAGRRGIDTIGHAIVLPQRDVPFQQIAGLASTRTFPLVSSFQPSYNMATNLVRNYTREQAEHLLNSSFAQYRADKDVVVLEGQIERNEAYLASYREKMACHLGDFAEYWALAERIQRLERSLARWQATDGRQQTRGALSEARPGQVYVVPSGKLRGPVVVVGAERSKRGEPRLLAVTRDRRLIRLTTSDFSRAPRPVANLRLGLRDDGSRPNAVDHATRRRLASELQALEVPEEAWLPEPLPEEREGADLVHIRRRMRLHPCHRCPDRERHAQWAERAARLVREIEGLRRRVRGHTETLSRRFERVLSVLQAYGYVEGFDLTPKGAVLAQIYNESDLLVAEALSRGWFTGLSAPELAALASTFVFESRGPIKVPGTLPTQSTRRAFERVMRLADRIKAMETDNGLELTRGCEAGFADVVYRWCKGAPLEDVLSDEATPGDFIRSCKQTVDLLRQLRDVTDSEELHKALGDAVDGTNRGVVAYTGVV